jgi:hypothetical protein
MPATQGNEGLMQLLQMIMAQLGGSPAAGRAAAGIGPSGPEAPAPTPAPPPEPAVPAVPAEPTIPELAQGSNFTPYKKHMYAQYGLDPDRLMFQQQLANFMSGLKFNQRATQSALAGQAGLFGNEGDILPGIGNTPGSLGSYA